MRRVKKPWERNMFKTAAAVAAITTILSSSAMAQVLTGGQFVGTTQYTALTDTTGICGGVLGLAAGQTSVSESTTPGLGKAWTSVINNVGAGTSASAYGVTAITCTFPKLPAVSAFKANGDGSFTATPAGAEVTTCGSTKGVFTLTSNNTTSGSLTQTNTVTLIANPTGSKDFGYEINTTNTALASGGTTLCYLSTSALYLNSQK
jgi:hypothetical protein